MRKPHFRLSVIMLAFCVLSLLACGISSPFVATPTPGGDPPRFSYTMTWHPQVSGFSDVSLALTAFLPPKALDFKPSDYVRVDLKAGSRFEISTDDTRYQCLETIAVTTLPILYAPESEVISGFAAISDLLVVYQACGSFLSQPASGFVLRSVTASEDLIFFKVTNQKLISTSGTGQELSPLDVSPAISPTPTPGPTINFQARINPNSGDCPGIAGQQVDLVLDNTASNRAVNWNATFDPQLASAMVGLKELGFSAGGPSWATLSSDTGTVDAGGNGSVVVTLSAQLCDGSSSLQISTYDFYLIYSMENGNKQTITVQFTTYPPSGPR